MVRRLHHLLVAGLVALLAPGAPGQEARDEFQLKAAYLFNFAKFVDWPAAAFARSDSPLILCVAGKNPFGAALNAYEHRSVNGRELRVRQGVSPGDPRGCHMVYVPESEERRLVAILGALRGTPVVTVSDIDGFIDAGGTIGFVEADARIRFEVNLAAAAEADVRLSAQLIRLARRVRGAT